METEIEDDSTDSRRKKTDESLRVERGAIDDAIKEDLTDIDETADAVISRARARSDALIAAARAKTDRDPVAVAPSAVIETERNLADKVLKTERSNADETIRDARAENVALLSREREETDRDLSSERVRADSALELRDEVLGIVSHDLLNMLTGVMGFAVLIETRVARGNHVEDVLKYARNIQRSGARMNRLIGDLVDIASIESGMLAVAREVGDPAQVVTEALEIFQAKAAENAITLVAEIVPPLPHAAYDPARILQVLTNLLSNALKFTPANGRVVVRVEHIGDEIRFGIRDTGIGIPREKLEAVFERYIQVAKNDRRGLGLGLYISRSIVQGHGGRIWAESKIGEGSSFCFTLPVQSRFGRAKSFLAALVKPPKADSKPAHGEPVKA